MTKYCSFTALEDQKPWRLYCAQCGKITKPVDIDPQRMRRVCRPAQNQAQDLSPLPPANLPAAAKPAARKRAASQPLYDTGDQLWSVFQELNVIPPKNCKCNKIKRQMNEWGPAGCRENFAWIVREVKRNAGKWKLMERIASISRAGVSSIQSGLVWRLNPLNPIPGLVHEAIRRSEENCRKGKGDV